MSQTTEVERGPNGFPYLDPERTQVGRWENGEFHLKVAREDGEMVCVNLTEDQFAALEQSVDHASATEKESDGESGA